MRVFSTGGNITSFPKDASLVAPTAADSSTSCNVCGGICFIARQPTHASILVLPLRICAIFLCLPSKTITGGLYPKYDVPTPRLFTSTTIGSNESTEQLT